MALVFKPGEVPAFPPSALVIRDKDAVIAPISVMTLYFIDQLESASGRVGLDDAYKHCKGQMAAYFRKKNEALRAAGKPEAPAHQPVLYTFGTQNIDVIP